MLTRLKVFETLINGNGDRLHPLKKAWGREENHFQVQLQVGSSFYLPARLRQVFEYLAQNVLQGVFVCSKVEKIEIDGSANQQSSDMFAKRTNSDSQAATNVLDQISQILFSNVTKYIDNKPKNKDEWIDHDEQFMYESVSSISESSQLSVFNC